MKDFVDKVSQKISKLSDEQVEMLFASISEENETLYSIIESLNAGLFILDNDWCLKKCNKTAERIFQFNSSQIINNNEKIWDCIEDNEISSFLKKCFNEGKTNTSSQFSISYHEKILFLNIMLQPLVMNKNVEGIIVLINDVTSRQQQEILTNRMNNLSSLTNLAASVAHEIKNPLGAISIHIQLLQKAIEKARRNENILPDKKFIEKYIDVVNEEINNLNTIVMDFLFAVRPVQARMELANPNEILQKTIDFFMPEFESNGISVTSKLCNDCPLILLDTKLFKEVIVNLLKNSQAAFTEQKNDKEIIVKSAIVKENFVLSVADNGCGMDEKTCQKIFEPYYTTKANGTGLGLTTVYKIIKEFNGDISVNSKPGMGTIFTITIPVPQNKLMLLSNKK